MNPKISVIIPTYYRNELLPEAIESVTRQDYDPVELIVVDDSGEGHAEPVLAEYDDQIDEAIVREENGGWVAANTTGIEASTGEYIQLLDDDDLLLEGKLRKTARVLQENPDVGVSYCGAIKGNEGQFYPKPEVRGDILKDALRFQTFPLWTGTLLMERDVLLDCMPFAGMGEDDDLEIELGDTDLKIELARRTNFEYVNECLAFYRRGENLLWTGDRRLKKIKQNIRHQQELYDQYPEIRRALLSEWYGKTARMYLEDSPWSAKAILYFLKSTYYADAEGLRVERGIETAASLFGQPGLITASRARGVLLG